MLEIEVLFKHFVIYIVSSDINYLKTEPNIMKQRKVLIAIAVVIFILLLLYWLFVAEDINAWLPVN